MTRLKRRHRVWLQVLLSLALLVVVVVAAGGFYAYTLLQAPDDSKAYTLEVKPGDTLPEVARRLQQAGVIRSVDGLRLALRLNGKARSLKEGYYDIPAHQSAQQVAEVLGTTPRPRIVTVTVPEGKRLRDLPAIFKKAGLGDPGTLMRTLDDAALNTHARGTLEGFLFPATYPFRPEATNLELARTMTARMNEEFTPARVAAAKALGLSVYDWVTLASMVQAEAANSAEMPTVAGVFINRLKDGIALGSDPTVAYGLNKDLPQLDRSAGDFTKDTPYSTYTRRGLPKGPINNPGQAALLSILSPRRSTANGREALYFLHGKDGQIHVNNTYAAHLRDIARYR